MTDIQELLRRISDTLTKLDALKEIPEVREAFALQAEQAMLVKRLCEQAREQIPQIMPYPVPVYPYSHPYGIYPWGPPWIFTSTSSSTDLMHVEGRRLPPHRNYQESLPLYPTRPVRSSYEPRRTNSSRIDGD